jgi:hypothetical protein
MYIWDLDFGGSAGMEKIGTAAACKLVGLDRAAFNSAVQRGTYQFPPPIVEGKGRLFDEFDLLQLDLFARLLNIGLTPLKAGILASLLRQEKENGITQDVLEALRVHFLNKIYQHSLSEYPAELLKLFLPDTQGTDDVGSA